MSEEQDYAAGLIPPPRRPASRFLTCMIIAASLFALTIVGAFALALAVAVGFFPHD